MRSVRKKKTFLQQISTRHRPPPAMSPTILHDGTTTNRNHKRSLPICPTRLASYYYLHSMRQTSIRVSLIGKYSPESLRRLQVSRFPSALVQPPKRTNWDRETGNSDKQLEGDSCGKVFEDVRRPLVGLERAQGLSMGSGVPIPWIRLVGFAWKP